MLNEVDDLLPFSCISFALRPFWRSLFFEARVLRICQYAKTHTRSKTTRLQTTFLQVSRLRRGATQRDDRLLYYKFCRFAARKSGMVGFGTIGMVYPNYVNYVKISFALRAAWSV